MVPTLPLIKCSIKDKKVHTIQSEVSILDLALWFFLAQGPIFVVRYSITAGLGLYRGDFSGFSAGCWDGLSEIRIRNDQPSDSAPDWPREHWRKIRDTWTLDYPG